DYAVGHHLGIVADPPEKAVGDAGSAARPGGDGVDAGVANLDVKDGGRAADDGRNRREIVVVEAMDETKAVPQGSAKPGVARGRADEREAGAAEADGARTRPFTDY